MPPAWHAALAFWTGLGVLESATAYARLLGTERQRSWVEALVGNMPWWLLWALFTPLVAALARRWPIDGGRWVRAAAAHAVAALVVSSAHLLLEGAAYYYTVSRAAGVPSLTWQWRQLFLNYLVLDVVTYCVIAVACYALHFAARYRASALDAARLEAQAARLELGLAEARMQALRMELNPHFFFNALNAIAGLVRRHDTEGAVRMLARLGELLRVTLDHDLAPAIPLRDELALLERYLDIERVRFGERLTIDVGCDAASLRGLVPPLLLQPLVENAIRHGVARRPGPARIEIRALLDDARLHLTVTDSGIGLDPSAAERREGVGLTNTRARLAELYGGGAALTLANAPAGGARVTLTLPYRAAREADVAVGA
jgi:signal transduction histidine kinase